MNDDTSKPARGDMKKPVKDEGWFATFTVLDVSGALHASQLRRLGDAITKAWKLILRGVSDRSKSRVVGV